MIKLMTALLCFVVSQAAQEPSRAPIGSSGTIAAVSSSAIGPPLDINAITVGPNFQGNDIVVIADIVRAAPALAPKSEFETSDEYNRRRLSFKSQPLSGLLTPDSYFAFLVENRSAFSGLQVKYDADTQLLSLRLDTDPIDTLDYLTFREVLISKDKYTASNAYGAKIEVTRYYGTQYRIAFESNSWLFREKGSFGEGVFSMLVAMSRDEARLIKPDAQLLIVCKLTEPWYQQHIVNHKATMDDPTELHTSVIYLMVTPEQVWLINAKTGAVLRKVVKP